MDSKRTSTCELVRKKNKNKKYNAAIYKWTKERFMEIEPAQEGPKDHYPDIFSSGRKAKLFLLDQTYS